MSKMKQNFNIVKRNMRMVKLNEKISDYVERCAQNLKEKSSLVAKTEVEELSSTLTDENKETLNLDDGEITFYKNGTTQGVAATDLVSGIDDTGWTPAVNCFDADCDFNFGSPPYSISSGNADANGYGNFEYAVPSGYFALNTKNLAEYG